MVRKRPSADIKKCNVSTGNELGDRSASIVFHSVDQYLKKRKQTLQSMVILLQGGLVPEKVSMS